MRLNLKPFINQELALQTNNPKSALLFSQHFHYGILLDYIQKVKKNLAILFYAIYSYFFFKIILKCHYSFGCQFLFLSVPFPLLFRSSFSDGDVKSLPVGCRRSAALVLHLIKISSKCQDSENE